MSMTLVSTTTVGAGGAASVTFTNIPQNAQDLVIYVNSRLDSGLVYSWVYAYPNQNTGASFTYKTVRFFDNSSVLGTNDSPFYTVGTNQSANRFGNIRIYLPDYVNSGVKIMLVESGSSGQVNAPRIAFYGFSSSDTSPTTSFSLAGVGNFLQHSTVSLYLIS